VVPALAVAESLRALGADVVFIGGARAEAELVPAAGYPLHTLTVRGLPRRDPLGALRALGAAALAFLRARALLRSLRPDAVMGAGGYVSGPVGLAAVTLRIPLVLTEADSHLGLANRMLAPFAWRVCLAFPPDVGGNGRDEEEEQQEEGTGRGKKSGSRYKVTGRPSFPAGAIRGRARARARMGPRGTCVLVFGGSLGARSINLAALDAYAGADFHVLHVCGRRDHPALSARPLPSNYDLRAYLDLPDFASALAAADLVVARAGGSIFEIAAAGRPAILVPYPHATADHQSANARWMARAGAALVIPDSELDGPRLARETAALLRDPARLRAMASASAALGRPDAAREVAAELLQAAGAGDVGGRARLEGAGARDAGAKDAGAGDAGARGAGAEGVGVEGVGVEGTPGEAAG
jgi:UDP-N-acetylglucosamine--N-acetylmuramyl-(pentapeptide) pyrophosphoryl-undecaprenol N-acetylglucosamine transferase